MTEPQVMRPRPGMHAISASEEWRAVVGHPNYEVSDRGRVRSIDRVQIYQVRGLTISRRHKGKMLVPGATKSGHLLVMLGRNNPVYVHRIILEAFVGPAPNGAECCHWNDDPTDNLLANLRWDTRGNNIIDFHRNKRRRASYG